MRRPHRRFSLTVRASALAAAALFTVPGAAPAAPGDLDLSFGGGTGVVHSPGSVNGASGMAVQPDGKILLAGADSSTGTTRMAVWRFHPDGSPDTSFDNGTGRAVAAVASGIFGDTVLVRSDGRILLIGNGTAGLPALYAASFLPDGQPDLSFAPAQNGFVIVPDFGPFHPSVLQPDGKILIAGFGVPPQRVLRLLPDGTPDPSFGTAGTANIPNTPFGVGICNAICLQSDGNILLGRDDGNFSVTRLTTSGALDTTFGPNGSGSAHLYAQGGRGACRAVSVLPDGRIIAGGEFARAAAEDAGFMFARYLPNGMADTTFGEPGTPARIQVAVDPVSVRLVSMAVQSDGRILAAGAANTDIALVRITAGGRADNSFGTAGRVRTDIGGEIARAAVLLPDEKLLVAGGVSGPSGMENLMVRYLAQVPVHLSVEHPPGTVLPAAPPAAVNFGPVTAGTRLLQITLRNTGLTPLTNLQATLADQSIPGDYHVTPPATAPLAPGAATTVIVSLTPSAAPGVRTATLRLTAGNTDPSLPPRLVPLTGSRATALEIWRVTWFGSPDNSGPGADANDFDRDGLPNFLEYATRSHPHVYTHDPCHPDTPGAFTYTRPTAALTEFSYQPETAGSPAGPWFAAGMTSTILTDDGTVQTVQVSAGALAAPRMFLRLRVTRISDQ